MRLVSIIINNFNYARFLGAAIDSALAQAHRETEVIVVDDGSTDDSRDVIARYGRRVRAVLKENGGQASAFNAGFAVSRGEVVLFLDADDFLYPSAASRAAETFAQHTGVAKVHWPLDVVDALGQRTGATVPAHALPAGDLRDVVLAAGPSSVPGAPTSGNAWARRFLERVLPAPEASNYYRLGGDEYLSNLAPLFGELRTVRDPQGAYRRHGDNRYAAKSFEDRLAFELAGHSDQCEAMAQVLRRHGYEADTERWRQCSWFHRLDQSVRELASAVPPRSPLVLIDDQTWGATAIDGRACVPFLERDGHYWGAPPDDAAAIAELERMRGQRSIGFVATAWPAFWWVTSYPKFYEYLRSTSECMIDNDRLLLFDVRPSSWAADKDRRGAIRC